MICNDTADIIIKKMIEDTLLYTIEINESTYIESQKGTVQTKSKANEHKRYFNKIAAKMGKEGTIYKSMVTSSASTLKIHIKILHFLHRFLNN